MSDLQHRIDTVTAVVATSGVPAPVWMPYLDGTSKVIAIIYAIISMIWLLKRMTRAEHSDR